MADVQWQPGFRYNPRVPQIDSDERRQAEETPAVYIWNVSPREFIENRGSLGRFLIPACPEGEEVSKPLIVAGWLFETLPDHIEGSDTTYKWVKTSGKKLAQDIMGIGPNKHDSQRYVRFGVFISEGTYPTEQEVFAAREHLDTYYREIVRKADELYEVNGGMEADERGVPRMAITRDHIQACKALGLDRPWARKQAKMMLCDECGESNMPSAPRCKNSDCRKIFDEAKCRQRFPEMFAHEHEERRGPGRPRKAEEVTA
jgi:hypothetical protein